MTMTPCHWIRKREILILAAHPPIWHPLTYHTNFVIPLTPPQQSFRTTAKMAKSIFNRKRDLVYLTFFIIHIPIMFCKLLNTVSIYAWENIIHTITLLQCRDALLILLLLGVDLTPMYPEALKPAFMTDLRKWYITTYRDQFFSSPP